MNCRRGSLHIDRDATATAENSSATGSPQSFTVGMATATISINNIPSNAAYNGSFTPTILTPAPAPRQSPQPRARPRSARFSKRQGQLHRCRNLHITARATATTDNFAVTGPRRASVLARHRKPSPSLNPLRPSLTAYFPSPSRRHRFASRSRAHHRCQQHSHSNNLRQHPHDQRSRNPGDRCQPGGQHRLHRRPTGATHIVVNPALLTVTANNLSRAYGAANPALTVTYTGFVAVTAPRS